MNAFGHPAQILLGLEDAMASGQVAQHDRITGQTALFDLGAEEASGMERPLPQATEVPVRERLRWEKELLGLYLSEHPIGEIAAQVADFATAYSGDLKDESLDGQRVTMVGIVTGFRRVITKANATMGVATIEDLQGSSEVVVFPKMFEQTAATWTDGAILVVAGRVDHRGEDVSLLADIVMEWDAALVKGAVEVAREIAAGDRGRGPRRQPVAVGPGQPAPAYPGNVHGSGNGSGNGNGHALAPVVPEPREIPYVSPLRAEYRREAPSAERGIAPAEPIPTYQEPPALERIRPDDDIEPALPDEARERVAVAARAPTPPVDASPQAILHVTFASSAGTDRVVGAMEAFKGLLVERPGSTRVVLHVPAPSGGASLPMELRRGVAYDSELLAEVRRRLGDGIVELSLS
jgi:DNA polymerase-3 subunit alpha